MSVLCEMPLSRTMYQHKIMLLPVGLFVGSQRCVCLCLMRQARLQRGNIKLKQGKLDDAKVDFEHIVSLMQIIYIP